MKTIKMSKSLKKELEMWDRASNEDYLRFECALMATDLAREKDATEWSGSLLRDIT